MCPVRKIQNKEKTPKKQKAGFTTQQSFRQYDTNAFRTLDSTAECVNSEFFTAIILSRSTYVAAVNPASEWSPVTMIQQDSDDGLF